MKKFFLPLLFCAPFFSHAQNDSIRIFNIKVLDGFFESCIRKAHVSVMEKDSTTLLVESLWETEDKENNQCMYSGNIPRRRQVVLRAECDGYGTEYLLVEIPKLTNGRPTEKFRVNRAIYLWEATKNELAEANVTASRILMVMKGDTIEYNAAAFRMHEGSMLDNLIRALPGVRLDDDGRITVNGEYVSSLLVNGRDFFNGDPRIALRNLPAYVVSKVRVYRQSDKRKFLRDEETDELEKRKDPLVMDVALKRDYAEGWISNYEVGGGGTLRSPFDARWMGRLFALRYTNHSSLGIYAGANNLNDGGMPGSKGEWKRMSATDGEKKTYMAGVNFSLDPKDTKIKFSTSFQTQREESLHESASSGEDYFEGGNVFHNTLQSEKNTGIGLRWNAKLEAEDKKGFYRFTPSLYYNRDKSLCTSTSSKKQNTKSGIDTLYTRTEVRDTHETKWGTTLNFSRYFHTQKAGDFTLEALFDYNRTTNSTRTECDDIVYKLLPESNISELRRYTLPAFDYNYVLRGEFEKKQRVNKLFNITAVFDYEFSQQFTSGHQNLETCKTPSVNSVTNEWLTPSSSLLWTLDMQNSYHTTKMERTHNFGPQLELKFKHKRMNVYQLVFSPNLKVSSRRIDDLRNGLEKSVTDDCVLFDPSVNLSWTRGNMKGVQMIVFNANLRHTQPDIYYLLNVDDNSNPLLHYEGNSNLGNTRQYSVSMGYNNSSWANSNNRNIDINAGYNQWKNNVGMARLYDRETGITTLRPYNIDGNWQTYAKISYSSFIGKGDKWNISSTSRFDLAHSTDFMSDRSDETLMTSSSDNVILTENFRVDYRIKNLRLSGKADVTWTRITSCQKMWSSFSYTDFNYGLSLSTPLVWGFNLDTDLMLYSRRGYSDPSMNTTDWVWNAELSHALGRQKQWVIKAIGFDLLNQISSVRKVVNSQGRTETWYNTTPSYATLHIIYRLDVKPKKK